MSNESDSENRSDEPRAYISYVSGAQDPERVPLGVKMKMLGKIYGHDVAKLRDVLIQTGVQENNAGVLASALGAAIAVEEAESHQSKQRLRALCDRFRRQPDKFSSTKVAEELQFLDRLEKSAIEEHFRAVIDKIGLESRKALMRFLNDNVAPAIAYGETDFIAISEDFPESLPSILEQMCSEGDAQ